LTTRIKCSRKGETSRSERFRHLPGQTGKGNDFFSLFF